MSKKNINFGQLGAAKMRGVQNFLATPVQSNPEPAVEAKNPDEAVAPSKTTSKAFPTPPVNQELTSTQSEPAQQAVEAKAPAQVESSVTQGSVPQDESNELEEIITFKIPQMLLAKTTTLAAIHGESIKDFVWSHVEKNIEEYERVHGVIPTYPRKRRKSSKIQ
jgi:hypothetical protein